MRRLRHPSGVILVTVIAGLGCASPGSLPEDFSPRAIAPAGATTGDTAAWTGYTDPMVMRAKNGLYYAFASQLKTDSGFVNIQVARSQDLKEWEQLRDALPLEPEWAEQTQEFRAPHIVELDGVSLMYYSAKPDSATVNRVRGGTCMNVAVSEGSVEGPYMDQGFPLHCVRGSVNMSPMAFDDPVTGKHFLYWSTGSRFTVAELRATRVQFDRGSDAVDLVIPQSAPATSGSAPLVEGIWVHYRAPYYYVFYSRRECCNASAQNSILVVRSRSATGPFEGRTGASGASEAVIVSPRAVRSGAGQASVVRDPDGEDWLVYDVVDSRRAQPATNRATNHQRTLVAELLVYADGWPQVISTEVSAASPMKAIGR